ncbi:MAG: type II toxin-antitoxin system RelE/ParE family toxin [Selenomonadaceae bacterium]|nr:type II toxin-antitoxin system RelE/ParE family toxin [Selenomonadaceae bacterium]MBQ7198564.1 type II toxin-antitoxin system RelE/ParE family toxin [Selenomonadaceae bacterium]
MYQINFYRDRQGNEPARELIEKLHNSKNQADKKRAAKINDYIQVLSMEGKAAGEPYIKHIQGELWELRPARDRIFFVAYVEDSFVLLHHFVKKTQKTPQREIERAFREIADLKERGLENE